MEASIDRTSFSETGTGERLSDPVLADIKEYWHWVRPALEEIIDATPFMELIPEDVYWACKAEDAHLWVTDDGFLVTTVTHEVFTGVRSLLVWFAYARRRGGEEAITYISFFEQVARDIGAKYVETKTAHRNIADYLEQKVGWQLELITLKKDVSHG